MAVFASSTRDLPSVETVPCHLAIIMDGNGRWAKRRLLPRVAGHRKGVETVRNLVKISLKRGIRYLTLFAFSSENWRRPPEEVSLLMQLFVHALEREVRRLKEHGVRLRVVGDLERFDPKLRALIEAAEAETAHNDALHLTIAANYGGRWDIMQAVNRMLAAQPDKRAGWQEADLEPYLAMHFAPEPDLFIRTGGEERISNFMLWQLAYTEFYFTKTLWPEFHADSLDAAIMSYAHRERRFGRTSEQLCQAIPSGPDAEHA